MKYRNIVVVKNKIYSNFEQFPKFKNANYLYGLLKDSGSIQAKPIVFIGSSIIERWNFELFFPDKLYINRGIGDQTSQEILSRFESDVIQLAPSKVIIYIGTNDIKYDISPDQSVSNIEKMITMSLSDQIEPLVLFMLPVNYNKNPSLSYSHELIKIKKLAYKLAGVCTKYNVDHINLFDYFQDKNDLAKIYLRDGLHLSHYGYIILTSEIKKKYSFKRN